MIDPAQTTPWANDPSWNRGKNGRQCKAKSKQNKRRCRNYALFAQTVCKIHGGAQRAAKRKACALILSCIDPSLGEEMYQIALDQVPEPRAIFNAITRRRKILARAVERARLCQDDDPIEIRRTAAETRKAIVQEIVRACAA